MPLDTLEFWQLLARVRWCHPRLKTEHDLLTNALKTSEKDTMQFHVQPVDLSMSLGVDE